MSTTFDRREFLQASAGVMAAGFSPKLFTPQKRPLRLGLIIGIGNDPETAIAKVHDLGLPTCQVYVDDFEQGLSTRLLQALDKHQIEATSVVVGGPGREVWDFYEGPLTILSARFRTSVSTIRASTLILPTSSSTARRIRSTPSRSSHPMSREFMPKTVSGRRTRRSWGRKCLSAKARWIF